MIDDRLPLLLDRAGLVLPETGTIAVIAPPAGAGLDGLPKDRVEIVHRHFPAHEAFRKAGYKTSVEITGPYTLAIVILPRAKADARQMLARAVAATDGPIVIDGQKTDGVDAVLKALRAKGTLGEVIAKAHGKIAVLESADLSDWAEPPVTDGPRTAPGTFSADGLDPGSAALIAALPEKLSGTVVDLGAGWGALSLAALERGAGEVHLVEADHAALEAARANITDPRAVFHWADARNIRLDAPARHVICNPPFHQGRSADPALGQAFIRNAARILARNGTLWLVANRHLPYERVLEEAFASWQTLDQSAGYKIIRAERPRPTLKGKSICHSPSPERPRS